MANGGIGLRYSQHYFENPLDMQFIDGLQHIEESRDRRLANIRLQTSADALSEEKSQYPQFQTSLSPTVYLSHIYYKQRWDSFFSDTHSIATAQNGYLPGPGQEPGTCNTNPELEDIDLSKELIRSNRIRMGLGQFGTKDDQNVLRSSSLMAHAFGWLTSCEIPVDQVEQNENEQIIESFFQKMAKTHAIENFRYFEQVLHNWKPSEKKPDYKNSFYTAIENPSHPVSKKSGIFDGIQPHDIQKLTSKHNPEPFAFFRENIMVQPNHITFNQISILQPEQKKFVVTNVQKKGEIVIDNILTSSPEVLVYLPKGMEYPIKLKPSESITVSVVVAPETWGLLQTAVIVCFQNFYNLMLPVTSFHINNDYELEPYYYTNVNVGEQIQGQIKIKNPSATEELEILEVYSTEEFLKLYWPNSVQLASQSEAQSNRDFSKYLKIEAGAKAKSILNFRFQTDQTVDHRAVIHMITSLGDVIRIPLYFHIYPDLLKFTPSIVDFGIVPFRFDALRIPVLVSIRNGFDLGTLYLNEVLLPISEKRLDFVMGKWDRDSYGNIQVFNKQSMRLEEHRRGILHKDRSLELLTVVLDPVTYGELNTSVILVFLTEDGQEYRVSLPIIGHVLRQNNLLVEDQFGDGTAKFSPWSVARPAITLNVKNQIADIKEPTLLKSKKVEERLIIFNNLASEIKGLDIVGQPPYAPFAYQSGSSSKQLGSTRSAVLAVGLSIQLGSFYVNLKDLKTTSGRLFFFLKINQNLFIPMAIQITDQNLVCSFLPASMGAPRHQDCQTSIFFDLKNVMLSTTHYRYVNMTNIGSDPVTIDWLQTTGENEVSVTFKELDPPHVPGSPDFPLSSYRGHGVDHTQKKINAQLQPRQTVVIQIGVEPHAHSVNLVSQRKVVFNINPPSYGQFKIDIAFIAQPGSAQFNPASNFIKFDQTFVGASSLQSKTINFNSTLPKPVFLRSIEVNNPQFKVFTLNSKLRNRDEVFRIQFDPNENNPVSGVALAIKNATDNSHIIQRVTNQESPITQNKKSGASNGKFLPIQLADITKHRSAQEQLFARRKQQETRIVSGTLTIETDQLGTVVYKLEGEIVQPQIVSESTINFGKVQIGQFASKDLVIQNPYSEPLQVQIYIGRHTTEIEAELRRLKLVAQTQQTFQTHASFSNYINEKIAAKLNYTRFQCFKTDQSQQSLLQDMTELHETPIILARESKRDLTCQQVIAYLATYTSVEQFEADSWMWLQIDEYFRQIILISANFESNTSLDNLSQEQLENLGLLQQLELLIDQLVLTAETQVRNSNSMQPVDQLILADLQHCSSQKPLLVVNESSYYHLTQQVSFPNAIDYYLPIRPYVRSLLYLVLAPLRILAHETSTVMAQETWLQSFQALISGIYNNGALLWQKVFERDQSQVYQMRPEDFLAQRQKDKQFQPAATTTNSLQFQERSLHDELVRNNGTFGAERNVQNFFLNQKYNRVLTIAPNQNLTLHKAIIYEPHALVDHDTKHTMTLYIKTDHTPLQQVQLEAGTGSSLIEFEQIWRVDLEENHTLIMNNIQHSLKQCIQVSEKKVNSHAYHNSPVCKNALQISQHVHQQIFGKSSLTSLISLRIDVRDALGSDQNEESYRIATNSFITRIKTFVNSATRAIFNIEPIIDTPSLPAYYEWRLLIANIGNLDHQPTQVGFEDPQTGEISCQSGDLLIQPCYLDIIQVQSFQTIRVFLKADYTTHVYKKTLVFESASHKQRFPLILTTDVKLLEFAASFQRSASWQSEWVMSVFMVIASVMTVTWKQVKRLKESSETKPNTLAAHYRQIEEPVLQSCVLQHYQQVQDRFRMHNSQFLREITNLGKRSNSAFTDYQKQVTSIRKQPPQSAITAVTQRTRVVKPIIEEPNLQDNTITQDSPQLVKEAEPVVVVPADEAQVVQDTPVFFVKEAKKETPVVVEKHHISRMNKKEKRAFEQREQRKRELELQEQLDEKLRLQKLQEELNKLQKKVQKQETEWQPISEEQEQPPQLQVSQKQVSTHVSEHQPSEHASDYDESPQKGEIDSKSAAPEMPIITKEPVIEKLLSEDEQQPEIQTSIAPQKQQYTVEKVADEPVQSSLKPFPKPQWTQKPLPAPQPIYDKRPSRNIQGWRQPLPSKYETQYFDKKLPLETAQRSRDFNSTQAKHSQYDHPYQKSKFAHYQPQRQPYHHAKDDYYKDQQQQQYAYHRNQHHDSYYDEEIEDEQPYSQHHEDNMMYGGGGDEEYVDEEDNVYEAHQPQLTQLQNYQKRPYWQNDQYQTKRYQKVQQPLQAPQTKAAQQTHQQQQQFGSRQVFQRIQPLVQPPQPVNLWKPKDPKTTTVQPQEQPPKQESPPKQVEEPKEQEPERNFYSAFKSIQDLFSKKARVVQANDSPTGSDSDGTLTNKQSFDALFKQNDQQLLSKQKESSYFDDQPKFSLFGDTIWGLDDRVSKPNQQAQQELFKPRAQQEPMLQFAPLRQFNNTMFTNSLEQLTKPKRQEAIPVVEATKQDRKIQDDQQQKYKLF